MPYALSGNYKLQSAISYVIILLANAIKLKYLPLANLLYSSLKQAYPLPNPYLPCALRYATHSFYW
jgi:hypothetical protein